MNKQLTTIVLSRYFCTNKFHFAYYSDNPTELRNQHFSKRKPANQQRNQPLFLFAAAKVHIFFEYTKLFLTFFFFYA